MSLWLVLPVLWLSPPAVAPCLGQQRPASITARVVDRESNRPVQGAQVSVLGAATLAISDSAGRAVLSGIVPGVKVLQVRAVGYALGSWVVQVSEGAAMNEVLALEPRTYALPDVTVEAEAPTGWRSPAAFERRRAMGTGYFLTQADIEQRRANTLVELLQTVPGVVSHCNAYSCNIVLQWATTRCRPEYFLDGFPATWATGPSFPVNGIRGIEVYRSVAQVPFEFQRVDMRCGVIAIWSIEPGTRLDRRR